MRHAVFQNDEGDSLMFEIVGVGISFVVVGQSIICASGTDDNGSSCIFPFGKEYAYGGLIDLAVFVVADALVKVLFCRAVFPENDIDGLVVFGVAPFTDCE